MADSILRRAVVLAAGRGKRMGAITEDVPKPMLPIGHKPLVEHILDRLSAAGVTEFCLVVGYQHEKVEQHFKNSKYAIQFVLQDPVNGTGSAALLAEAFAADEPFLLTYGDILCDLQEYVKCSTVMASHPATSVVLAVKEVDDPWQGAAVYEVAGRISRIVEKPPKGMSMTRWNSAGFYLFRPVLFDYLRRIELSARGELELTSALDLMLSDRLELRISPIAGDWRDVGRPEDLEAANALPQ